MNATSNTNKEQSKKVRVPRRVALIVSIVIAAFGHIAVPWVYSLLAARHGWVEGHPSWWNILGLSLAAIGFGGLLWCLGLHFARAPETVELNYIFPSVRSAWKEMMKKLGGRGVDPAAPGATSEPATSYLVKEGPHRFSRHPMYLSVIMLWLGWSLFYGSILVFIMWVVTWLGMVFFVAPSEERQLEARFGETYLQYKNKVPRWFGKSQS